MIDKNQIGPGKVRLPDAKVADNATVRLGDATITGHFAPKSPRH